MLIKVIYLDASEGEVASNVLDDKIVGICRTNSVGRFGTTDEVAEVIVMMSKNGNFTGQTINVNGGWYMS